MAKKITGKKAMILAEACKIDKRMKADKARLTELKAELKLGKGSYLNDAGDAVTVSQTKKYTEINPEEAYNAMKALKQGKRFFGVVKVKLTELKRILNDAGINGLREETGEITTRFCFK